MDNFGPVDKNWYYRTNFCPIRERRRTLAADRGRPSPGGEEARVVSVQPRGVGLNIARIKSGHQQYYTSPDQYLQVQLLNVPSCR
ncbi:hypothetical protein FND50_03920 [Rhodococcus sp. WB9]|nr:hypothetical protein FND50_03920 [Rhodococcus sp. WB9]